MSPNFFSFVAIIHHEDFILHAYICIMRSLRDQNSSFCYYLSPFYLVEMKILTFISPARMTLNRGICKTPILTLRSLMASYHTIHCLKDHCAPCFLPYGWVIFLRVILDHQACLHLYIIVFLLITNQKVQKYVI